MPFIPLSFVATILLAILFVTVARRDSVGQGNIPFLILILVAALLSFLSGLRWGYGVGEVAFIAPVAAITVPALAYCGVAVLIRQNSFRFLHIALHAIPAVILSALIVVYPAAIDLTIIATFVGYAVAILLMMRPGVNALYLTPFESVDAAYRAVIFAALALLFSAALDVIVFLDFALFLGQYAVTVITVGNLISLAVLAIAAAGLSHPSDLAEATGAEPYMDAVPNDAPGRIMDPKANEKTLLAIETLLSTKHIYRDVDLSLHRLARKLGIPARQISTAINEELAKNVSQYINEFRVAEACDLLIKTDKPVTEIMFDVGFQTKSNFNREFRRVTDMTPVQWRGTKTEV